MLKVDSTLSENIKAIKKQEKQYTPVSYTHLDVYKRQGLLLDL